MIIGLTATREGLSEAQIRALRGVIAVMPERIVHGGAVGGDECLDRWFRRCGLEPDRIEVYPCATDRARLWAARGCVVHPVMTPLHRNRIIAARCDHLLACPGTMMETLRSGTWATVRYARAAGRPITLVLPDGSVREEGP